VCCPLSRSREREAQQAHSPQSIHPQKGEE
jgi:hypothetical protein